LGDVPPGEALDGATNQAINASNNATAVQQAEIAADVTKSTFVPPP